MGVENKSPYLEYIRIKNTLYSNDEGEAFLKVNIISLCYFFFVIIIILLDRLTIRRVDLFIYIL
jgi:hypothetical protein